MRILALSDFHHHYELFPHLQELAKSVDLIIDAGDFTVFEDDMAQTLHRYAAWGKPILLIHGNHETAALVEAACRKEKNIRLIHQQDIDVSGVRILGWGGGGFNEQDRKFEDWNKGITRDGRPTVLVTHPPPYGTALDEMDDRHIGNKSIREFIERLQPDYALSGHLHDTQGAEDSVGRTRCINLGPHGRIIELKTP